MLNIVVTVVCVFLLVLPALLYFAAEFRRHSQLRMEAARVQSELLRVSCWQLVVPSYAEDYNYSTCDKATLLSIAAEFGPISAEIEAEDFRTGCGGCSIVLSSPDSNMSFVVGDRWGQAIWSTPGEEPTAVRFTFRDDSLLERCSNVTGFGYPLDPVSPRDVRSR